MIAVIIFGLLLPGGVLRLTAASLPSQPQRQQITPNPAGPFHVSGNSVLDSQGRRFLMRGTQLTDFHPATVERDNRAGLDFGPHSATSLSAIRLRFNMNTVRLPLNVLESDAPNYFSELAKVVQRANQIDLLVVLAAREPGADLPSARTAEFWSRCAAYFRDYPNVLFDVFSDPSPAAVSASAGDPHSQPGWDVWRASMQGLVKAVRATGATQPVVVMGWKDDRLFEGADASSLIDDPNIIYEASPRFANTRTDAERDAHLGALANRVPVMANGWDLELDDAAACAAIPSDPSSAAALVLGNLDYFDAHRISWTVSVFEPGN
jgi:Cellulase (glycosyl hydrolase family 5)